MEQAQVVKECLELFCKASGETVSYHKSSVLSSKNTSLVTMEAVSSTLGIPMTDDLGYYLGMPTFNGRVMGSTFEKISQRVDSHLAGWRGRMLSIVGRITLIQSCVSSIPSSAMQTTRLPRTLYDDIDRRMEMGKLKKYIMSLGVESHRKRKQEGLASDLCDS